MAPPQEGIVDKGKRPMKTGRKKKRGTTQAFDLESLATPKYP